MNNLKWIAIAAIVVIVVALLGALYYQHRSIVKRETEFALQKYNFEQLQQNLKDKDIYIKVMQDVSNHKSEIVANLYIERDSLETKFRDALAQIEKNVREGHDRKSSKVLQDAIKALGEMQ